MDFYYMAGSSPCRSVLMTAKTLGVQLNKKKTNLMTGEHLKPEYLKLNPQHTVPTLVDHGFSLWESRAILIYLAEKYGKNEELYPKGAKERAVVNQRLYFDMGTLIQSFAEYYMPQFRLKKPADPEKFKQIETAFELLDKFLDGQTYVAGKALSVADIAILATVSTFDVVGFKFTKYANVAKWYEHLKKTVSGWDENWAGCIEFKTYFQ